MSEIFVRTLSEGIRDLLGDPFKDDLNGMELEFRLRHFEDGQLKTGQSFIQFSRIVDQLQSDRVPMKETTTLDISSGQGRLTIETIDAIKNYCRSGALDPKTLTYINKIREDQRRHDFTDYNLRFQVSEEIPMTETEIEKFNKVIMSSALKSYRYKQRYSFQVSKVVRIDMTVVKSAVGQSMKSSAVLKSKEAYEVEMEYITQSPPKKIIDFLTPEVITHLYHLIIWSQDSPAISAQTERQEILMAYKKLAYGEKASSIPGGRFFVGADVMPLTRNHIQSIREDYSVTEKADGERHLLFIPGEPSPYQGVVYLINNRFEIKSTGYRTDQTLLHGSLLDGELVMIKSGSGSMKRPIYLIFDCFFLHYRDLRPLPLHISTEKIVTISQNPDKDIRTRYNAINWADIQLNSHKQTIAREINMGIIHKNYLYPTKDNESIFSLAKKVWEKTYDYNLDGLIFTPLSESYPITSDPLKLPRFDRLLKWKPSGQLSIDFWVTFMDKQSLPDPQAPQRRYIRAKLMAGEGGHLVDFIPRRQRPGEFDSQFNVIHLIVDNENRPHSKDGNIIYDQSVVEFVYDSEKGNRFEWIPLRSRPDKTQRGQPNSIRTAQSTWILMLEPVPVEMVTTDVGLTTVVAPPPIDEEYYDPERTTKGYLVKSLRDYHNQIKRYVITSVCRSLRQDDPDRVIDLLDVACGQAGDLSKWNEAKITYVLGVDYSEFNLTNPRGGAIDRAMNSDLKYPRKIEFVWGDSSRYFNDGSAGQNDYNTKQLIRIFKQRMTTSFDIISCQFALHYFFKNLATLQGLLYNISMNLKVGGYFIGTTIDGSKLFEILKNQAKIEGKIDGDVIWRLEKRYKDQDFKSYGQEIMAYNINIGKDIPEYLVNFEFLGKIAEQYHLRYLDPSEIKGLQGIESFEMIAKRDPRLEKLMNKMTEDEKRYSFLNSYFILQKIESTQPLPSPISASAPAPVESNPTPPVSLPLPQPPSVPSETKSVKKQPIKVTIKTSKV